MKYENAKKIITDILREHTEGLTLIEISKLSKMNRLTVNKFIHELIGEGKIYQRIVGNAKLCYLIKKISKRRNLLFTES